MTVYIQDMSIIKCKNFQTKFGRKVCKKVCVCDWPYMCICIDDILSGWRLSLNSSVNSVTFNYNTVFNTVGVHLRRSKPCLPKYWCIEHPKSSAAQFTLPRVWHPKCTQTLHIVQLCFFFCAREKKWDLPHYIFSAYLYPHINQQHNGNPTPNHITRRNRTYREMFPYAHFVSAPFRLVSRDTKPQ